MGRPSVLLPRVADVMTRFAVDIGATLRAFPIPRVHSSYGEGSRYAIGGRFEEPHPALGVNPESGVVRYSSESLQVKLFRQGPPYRERKRVLFSGQSEAEYSSLSITDEGEVTLVVNPKPLTR